MRNAGHGASEIRLERGVGLEGHNASARSYHGSECDEEDAPVGTDIERDIPRPDDMLHDSLYRPIPWQMPVRRASKKRVVIAVPQVHKEADTRRSARERPVVPAAGGRAER